jgi:hypothetical protein
VLPGVDRALDATATRCRRHRCTARRRLAHIDSHEADQWRDKGHRPDRWQISADNRPMSPRVVSREKHVARAQQAAGPACGARCQICRGGSRRMGKETRASYREPLPSTRLATGLRRRSFSQRPPRTLASKMTRRQTRRRSLLRPPRSSSCLDPAQWRARTPRVRLSSRKGSRPSELRTTAPLSRRMWRCSLRRQCRLTPRQLLR